MIWRPKYFAVERKEKKNIERRVKTEKTPFPDLLLKGLSIEKT